METHIQKPLRIAIILLVALFFYGRPATLEGDVILGTPSSYTIPPAEPIPVHIPDVMRKIAWCESQNRQFNPDGTVFRGIQNPLDTGKWQINKKYHLTASQALGMDIETLEGNTAYAAHVYASEGTTPWNWSKHCWADPDRVWWEKDGDLWSTNKK